MTDPKADFARLQRGGQAMTWWESLGASRAGGRRWQTRLNDALTVWLAERSAKQKHRRPATAGGTVAGLKAVWVPRHGAPPAVG